MRCCLPSCYEDIYQDEFAHRFDQSIHFCCEWCHDRFMEWTGDIPDYVDNNVSMVSIRIFRKYEKFLPGIYKNQLKYRMLLAS